MRKIWILATTFSHYLEKSEEKFSSAKRCRTAKPILTEKPILTDMSMDQHHKEQEYLTVCKSRRQHAYWSEFRDKIVNGDPELDHYRVMLWSLRIKATLPRMHLMKLLYEHKSEKFTAKDIANRLSSHKFGTATIYRSAALLEKAGLITKDGDRSYRWK